MNFRLTLSLVIVLALLFAGYFGYQAWFVKDKPVTVGGGTALIAPVPNNLDSITISHNGQPAWTLVRNDAEWNFTQPIQAPADDFHARSLADFLRQLNYRERFEPEASGAHSAQSTGLASPVYSASFTDDAGKKYTVDFGKTTVSGIFARLSGANTIYLLNGNPISQLEQEVADMRKKAIKRIARNDIRELKISRAGESVTLAKNGDKWMITAPIPSRANMAAVDEILDTLSNVQADSFPDLEKSVAGTGLTPPQVAVTAVYDKNDPLARLTAATASTSTKPATESFTLELGYFTSLVEKQTVYASVAGTNDVFAFNTDAFKKLNRKLKDVRDPAITPQPVIQSTDVLIAPQGQPAVHLVKSATEWRLAGADVPGELAEIASFLGNLGNLRAINFVDGAGDLKSIGLDPPQLRVELTLPKESQHEIILVGKPEAGEGGGKVTPVMRQGEPTVYLVQSGDVEKLKTSPLAFRARAVERLDADNIREIAVTGPLAPAGGLTLTRQGTTWNVIQNKKTITADLTKIVAILSDFTPLTAQRWEADKPELTGDPDLTVTLSIAEPIAPPPPTTTTAPSTSTAPATAPATAKSPASIGPVPTQTITRTLRLHRTGKAPETWKAVWENAPTAWTFQPQLGLVDHLIRETYTPPPPATTQSATQPATVPSAEPATTSPAQ